MARHLPPVYSPVSVGAIASSSVAGRRVSHARLKTLLRNRFNAEHVVLTGSGTQALQLAIAVACADGGVVALPAYSCFDLVSAAVGADVRVLFYDVDATTLAPDLGSLEQCVAEGAQGIVAGNLYGYPLPWTELRRIAASADAVLIEDAAQGLGSVGGDTPAGQAGDLTVLSFGRGKGWTGGGGGALLVGGGLEAPSPSSTFSGRWRSTVTSLAAWLLGRPSMYGIPASIPGLRLGETVYHPPTDPESISPFSAALAARTQGQAFRVIADRREQAKRWALAIHERDPARTRFLPCLPLGGFESAASLRFATRLQQIDLPSDTWARLRQLGVESGYPLPLPALPEVSALCDGDPAPFPGAESLASTLITLPTHHWVRESDRAAVLDLLADQAQ